MATETLKYGILIPIVTSKELHFYADFKYISFIKFNLTHQSYEPQKICVILGNRGKNSLKVVESQRKSYRQIQRIREPHCRSFKLLSTKMWHFVFFVRRQLTHACLFVFFPGVIVSTQWSYNVARELILMKIKSSRALFK